ncbi:T9SS type A sorting domain-containing protein [Candidatus Latescibacterota bacterium]
MRPPTLFAEIHTILTDTIEEQNERASKTAVVWPRKNNPVHMLVVFSKFKGEAPGDSLAPVWADKIFDNNPGSVPHYCETISFGQIKVTGEYIPKRYELPQDSSYYVNQLEEYINDLLDLLDNDPTVDFSHFDNDGPDGIPASTDDDGYVDYLALMPMSRPYNFIDKYATGYGYFGEFTTYETHYKNLNGELIKIDKYSGCIVTTSNQNQGIGTLCHEYCHSFGTLDLYDEGYEDNETDSAGIGYWGIMGRGNLGWNETTGPVAPCAYTRMVLGCIGLNNANLVDIYGQHRNLRISDVGLENGHVYRIWVGNNEYFLIEHRRNDGIYYDRLTPQNGLLIWHVYENVSSVDELIKRCDLECPDGRYTDAGYPLGMIADPLYGGDNLDFWAHDYSYSAAHAGNHGDATDVYDGIIYTRFGPDTNPNTNSKVTKEPNGIDIFNIHPEGNEMVFDVKIPPFIDWISNYFPLIGTGIQRFMGNWQIKYPAQKETACYLLNYSNGITPDRLVTVYADSLTVDDISSLDYLETQKAIEQRMFLNNMSVENAQIIRENISFDTFGSTITELGINPDDIFSDAIPRWIQKSSFAIEEESLPDTIVLSQNYPNPFNALTTITYTLPVDSAVTLEIFNLLGQKIIEQNRGFEHAGSHSIILDAAELSSGLYLYRINGTTVSETKKFLLIR